MITGTQIQTYTGIGFDPINPDPELIKIEDIAHALSNQCRFSGHARSFYSVAQHSAHCAEIACLASNAPLARAMLLHDASEAYLLDMPRPLKKAFPQYAEIEDRLMRAIADKFKFDWPMTPAMKEIDDRVLFTEKKHLLKDRDWGYQIKPYDMVVDPWVPHQAEFIFMVKFGFLFPEFK